MKIIVWGINYAPEVTGIAPCNTALCNYLHANGHDVEMLTTFSYYPQWKKAPEDEYVPWRTDYLEEVPVHRCWHFVPKRLGVLKRVLCEGSFVLNSFLRALFLKTADVYVVVSPPLLLGPAAWLLTKIKGGIFHFHVQDLQPDAALGLNMLKPGLFTRMLYVLEAFSYRKAARVSGIGSGMMEAFRQKGVPEEKVSLLPNGIDLDEAEIPVSVNFREKYRVSPDAFLAVYAGNLGAKQGLEIILDAAAFVGGSRVELMICGDGGWREILAERIAKEKIQQVRLLPLLDDEDYRAMLHTADVCLITQKAGSGNAFLPSKLLPTLAYQRAVVSVADEDSALARAMEEGHFGKNVLPGEPETLARVLLDYAEEGSEMAVSRTNGYAYVSRFDHATVLATFEKVLKEECGEPAFVPTVVAAPKVAALTAISPVEILSNTEEHSHAA